MYKTQLIEFSTFDKLLLPGLLFTPQLQKNKKTTKAAIFLHGNGSASVFYGVTRAKALAEQFTKQGIALLLFNNRGAHFIKTINQQPDEASEEIQAGYNDVTLGCTYELIKDCVPDINGAVRFLLDQGYDDISLIGHSSGANKICVYDHYQPQNKISRYVLLAGGDDTGLYFQRIGNKSKFFKYLQQAQAKIEQSKGEKLVPKYITDRLISYQSFYDIAHPDGDYNTFPFTEHQEKIKLSTKPLFRYFAQIKKPSLVVYGEHDDYAPQQSGQLALNILQQQVKDKNNFEFQLIAQADHSFHGREQELGRLVANWLS